MKMRAWIRFFIFFAGLAISLTGLGETYSGQKEMNGIRFNRYTGFEKTWPLVTVRFRTDTGEQRFTYANKLAYKTLKDGKTDYPDGAVFAKIGVITEEDPLFTSSKVPSGSVRFQFMVRDRKKYASTGGWGYALFNGEGVTFNEEPLAKTMACYACHQVAQPRGQVFSQIVNFGRPTVVLAASPFADLTYSDHEVSGLPDKVRTLISSRVKQVRFLEGGFRMHAFDGTMNEIRPALIAESKKSGSPAMLMTADQSQLSLVMPLAMAEKNQDSSSACASGKVKFVAYFTIASEKNARERIIQNLYFCD